MDIPVYDTDDVTPPGIPGNVVATVVSDTKIKLTWDASGDANGVDRYRIYNQDGITIGVSAESVYSPDDFILNEYVVALLQPSTTYSFTVTALDPNWNESDHSVPAVATTLPFEDDGTRINPLTDIEYKGAFKLPGESGGSNWGYGGYGLTHYPNGDPSGPEDGYPGSLFGRGHVYQMYVSEISIPEPVISSDRNDLPTATTLQPFSKVDNFDHPDIGIPIGDMAYLPKQGSQTSDKLYYTWGSNYNWSKLPSHSASDLDLSNPHDQGWWYVGASDGDPSYYGSVFYMFEIPQAWADAYASGYRLVTGGTRSGAYNGFGNSLHAIAPWKDGDPLPGYEAELSYQTLMKYGQVTGVNTQDGRVVTDAWHGGAWLTSGNRSAIVFTGSKGYGEITYTGGYYCTFIKDSFLFYDPKDIEDVVSGQKETYEPQPYAILDVSQYMHRGHLKSAAYDRENGLLYVHEAYHGTPVVHVFTVRPPASLAGVINILKIVSGTTPATSSGQYKDVDGDGRIGLAEAIGMMIEIAK